jgi:hypothetical protein
MLTTEATILRISHSSNYTVLGNEMLRLAKIAYLPARAVWQYLISQPSGWRIDPIAIRNALEIGDYRVRKAIKYLKELGYLHMRKIRNAAGRFTYQAIVVEDPKLFAGWDDACVPERGPANPKPEPVPRVERTSDLEPERPIESVADKPSCEVDRIADRASFDRAIDAYEAHKPESWQSVGDRRAIYEKLRTIAAILPIPEGGDRAHAIIEAVAKATKALSKPQQKWYVGDDFINKKLSWLVGDCDRLVDLAAKSETVRAPGDTQLPTDEDFVHPASRQWVSLSENYERVEDWYYHFEGQKIYFGREQYEIGRIDTSSLNFHLVERGGEARSKTHFRLSFKIFYENFLFGEDANYQIREEFLSPCESCPIVLPIKRQATHPTGKAIGSSTLKTIGEQLAESRLGKLLERFSGREEVGREEVGREEVGREEVGREEVGWEEVGDDDPLWNSPEDGAQIEIVSEGLKHPRAGEEVYLDGELIAVVNDDGRQILTDELMARYRRRCEDYQAMRRNVS